MVQRGEIYEADWIETLYKMEPEMQKKFIANEREATIEKNQLLTIIKRNQEALRKIEEIADGFSKKTKLIQKQ